MNAIQRLTAVFVLLLPLASTAHGQRQLQSDAKAAMRTAAEYFHGRVAVRGGYVYHYSLDLKQRWGEGMATPDQVWVQPPGTPTVGMAYLRAYEATGDGFYLDAATDAAMALVYGQLKSGGWTNAIDFDPKGKGTALYRNGRGKGKNNSSLDDGQSQSAIQLLVQADRALNMQHQPIHEAAQIALKALLQAQFPNGGFPQVWTGPVVPQPIVRASYPSYDWRTEGRIKNYWDMYTLNDNVTGYVADALIDAHRTYQDPQYLQALGKLGDFLVLAQMPEPQPGWAQQYNYEMKPIWARRFEPPGVSGDETQEVIETLLKIASATGDRRYLEPIPRAIRWLERSQLPGRQLARYYELQTNRPLYMSRRGDQYSLTYSDTNLPSHYGWKTDSRVAELRRRHGMAKAGRSSMAEIKPTSERVREILRSLDAEGRWISTFDGTRLVGQAKMPIGTRYLSSQVFSDHLTQLSAFVSGD